MTNLNSILKSRDITLSTKVRLVKGYGFSSSQIWIWEFDHKVGSAPKNYCFWILVLENILENSFDCKEIKPVNSKRNQPWIFIGRTDAEAEALIFWPPDAELTSWKRPWWWERLRAGGEGDDRGWDGWMALTTQWTWVWANSRRCWRTGKPGVLQSMGLQRVDISLWLY